MYERHPDIGDILIGKGLVTPGQVAQARQVQAQANAELGDLIAELGFTSEDQVARCRATIFKLSYLDISRLMLDTSLLHAVPKQYLFRYCAIPIERRKNGKVVLAVANPLTAMPVFRRFEDALGTPVEIVVTAKSVIHQRLVKLFGPDPA